MLTYRAEVSFTSVYVYHIAAAISGVANTCADARRFLSVSNAVWHSALELNGTAFFVRLNNGAAITLKFGTNER